MTGLAEPKWVRLCAEVRQRLSFQPVTSVVRGPKVSELGGRDRRRRWGWSTGETEAGGWWGDLSIQGPVAGVGGSNGKGSRGTESC